MTTPTSTPTFRFTASADQAELAPQRAGGSVLEELRVMLRDGVNAVAEGTLTHDGHDYVFVDYVMDADTAQAWYDRYTFLGMWQVSA